MEQQSPIFPEMPISDSPSRLYAKSLERVWELYPRREAKAKAFERMRYALKSGAVTYAVLIAKVRQYAAYVKQEGLERRFIPLMGTWINHERWKDDTLVLSEKAQIHEMFREWEKRVQGHLPGHFDASFDFHSRLHAWLALHGKDLPAELREEARRIYLWWLRHVRATYGDLAESQYKEMDAVIDRLRSAGL